MQRGMNAEKRSMDLVNAIQQFLDYALRSAYEVMSAVEIAL
jgi:hypothetical protein